MQYLNNRQYMFALNEKHYLNKQLFLDRFSLQETEDIEICSGEIYSSFVPSLMFGVLEQLISTHNCTLLNSILEKCNSLSPPQQTPDLNNLAHFLRDIIECLQLSQNENSTFRLIQSLYNKKELLKRELEILCKSFSKDVMGMFVKEYRVKIIEYLHQPEDRRIISKNSSESEDYTSVVRIVKLEQHFHLLYEFSLKQMDSMSKVIRGVRIQYEKQKLRTKGIEPVPIINNPSPIPYPPNNNATNNQCTRPVSKTRIKIVDQTKIDPKKTPLAIYKRQDSTKRETQPHRVSLKKESETLKVPAKRETEKVEKSVSSKPETVEDEPDHSSRLHHYFVSQSEDYPMSDDTREVLNNRFNQIQDQNRKEQEILQMKMPKKQAKKEYKPERDVNSAQYRIKVLVPSRPSSPQRLNVPARKSPYNAL